jgi:hypothetical protein
MVRQVPDVGKEPISTRVESYFLKNHPDSYLTHQVCRFATFFGFSKSCRLRRVDNGV